MSRSGNNECIKKEGRSIPESYAAEVAFIVVNQAQILHNAMKNRLVHALSPNNINYYRPEETKAYNIKLVTEVQEIITHAMKSILESL